MSVSSEVELSYLHSDEDDESVFYSTEEESGAELSDGETEDDAFKERPGSADRCLSTLITTLFGNKYPLSWLFPLPRMHTLSNVYPNVALRLKNL